MWAFSNLVLNEIILNVCVLITIISLLIYILLVGSAPLSTGLSNRFGYQPVVILGGFLTCLGTICTAFTSCINQIYITIGIVSGNQSHLL